MSSQASSTDSSPTGLISSVAAHSHGPNGAPYSMGKAALESLAYTLAKEEMPHGIHVNIVAPGLVETDMGVRLARAIYGGGGTFRLRISPARQRRLAGRDVGDLHTKCQPLQFTGG